MQLCQDMSKSKVKNKIELKSNLIEIVVDATETEFEVQLQSDDAGTHFMIYLPESGREKFNIKEFRKVVRDTLGRVRVLLCFVPDGYIENCVRAR